MLSFNTLLYVENFAECLQFYRTLLQCEPRAHRTWMVEFLLGERYATLAGSALSLLDVAHSRQKASRLGGLTLVWQVADIQAQVQRLRLAGIVVPEPQLNAKWQALSVFFADPDGNRVELWEKVACSE
ncbi:MAG TPA: VOC family protein [Anaerolineales bacterium]|nr:VOC family protein [Anaerolineales bacterium]